MSSKKRKAGKKKRKKKDGNSSGLFKSMRDVGNKYPSQTAWKRVFYILSALVFVSLVFCATQVGVNGDEDVQVPYSYRALDFYKTYGADTSVFNSTKGPAIRYYGAGYEFFAGTINQTLGFEQTDRAHHHVRHLLVALFGFICLIGVGFLAKVLTNWRGATFALTLLWLSPRFFGHALINGKDIPFAAGYIVSLLFMFLIFRTLPKVKWRDVIGLLIGMGYVLSVRSGGILVFIYFFAFFITFWLLHRMSGSKLDLNLKKLGKVLGIPLIGGFIFGIVLWPFGLLNPIGHTMESLTTFSNFPISVRVLFSGDMVMSNQIPFEYLFTWIYYTIPIAFMVGLLLFLFTIRTTFQRSPRFLILCSVFAFLFPLFYVLYKDSPLYDGWRHFNFVYAAGIPLVALAFENAALWVARKKWKSWIVPLVFGLLMLEPAIHIVKNYEYPYVYFNPVAGGMNGAFGNFELDYWGISTRQAVEELEDRGILKHPMDSSITLVSNFSYGTRIWLQDKYRDSVTMKFSRYRERYDMDWDYAIYVSRFMDGAHMKAIDWPGSNRVIETIDVNNTPITAIYKKTNNYAFEARKAMNSGNVQRAVELFNREIAFDPNNEIAYNYLGRIFMDQGNTPKAIEYFEKAHELSPDDQQVTINLALGYANTGNIPQANALLLEMVEKDPSNYLGYYYLALIASQSNNHGMAARYIEDCIEARPNFKPAYVLGAKIYRATGDNARASYFESIANQLR